MFDDDSDEGYFYEPAAETMHNKDFVLDEESGITWGNVCDALRLLYDEKGHSGPFTLDEFYNAILEILISPELNSLVNQGLIEVCMSRDGEMGYKLTPLGASVAESIEELVVDEINGEPS